MPKTKRLYVYYIDNTEQDESKKRKVRYVAEKWQWQDTVMGEQYITFTASSDVPIPFAVGDFCEYRGERFYLNYIPSETQNARPGKVGNGFVYSSVKFESYQEELTRCQMRDITASTGKYIASLGTNYTGSSTFSLYCGETIYGGKTYTPVCALAAKIQANLDAMYHDAAGKGLWDIVVNTETFHDEFGSRVYDTHTDEKVLSFNNNYVSEALAMVYTIFKLNYYVRGRKIYIGYQLGDLTSYNSANPTAIIDDTGKFSFGYGKGNPSSDNPNKGLFQMKKVSNPSQQIITRLRAFGSKKNMPYRYYNKKYNLSQSLFPVNLMLPDTFKTPELKNVGNIERKTMLPTILDVKGDSNDSFIEKGNNASLTTEGVREGSAFWDGTNEELEEIYPTIEGTTYAELRSAGIPDQDGATGALAFPGYDGDERIDEILAICDDTNIGNGINYDQATKMTVAVTKGEPNLVTPTNASKSDVFKEKEIATFNNVMKGSYLLTKSIQSLCATYLIDGVAIPATYKVKFEFIVRVLRGNTIVSEKKKSVNGDYSSSRANRGAYEMIKVEFPDFVNEDAIDVPEEATIKVYVKITETEGSISLKTGKTTWDCGIVMSNNNEQSVKSETPNVIGNLILRLRGVGDSYQETPFHVILKDIGFDITASFYEGEDAVISMKSGNCVARKFSIGEVIEKVEVTRPNGTKVKGYKIYLTSRDVDDVLNTFFPSEGYPIKAGDKYVLLGIEMPDVFVKAAEIRLLKAACEYLKKNCETKFTYQPYLDDIFVERDYDKNIAANTPENSIYWRLYAGLKFTFREIPKSANETSFSTLSVMIQSITIKEGEKYTPQIEITLNDDIQQTTLQKIQTSVSRIENQTSASISLRGSYSQGATNGANGGTTNFGGIGTSAVLQQDLTATKSVGNVKVGDKFEKGTLLEDIIRQILTGEVTPVKTAPTFSWINCPSTVEYGSAKQDISAKATLNNATEIKAVYLSINGEPETDITKFLDKATGVVLYHEAGSYDASITYIMRCVFIYEGKDYPITISSTTSVMKPLFFGKFTSKKTSLTASEITNMEKVLSTPKVFSISGGNTIAFAVPKGLKLSVEGVTEDGFSADWSNWKSATSGSSETNGVQLGSKTQDYNVYFAYSEGGFGDVKGTIQIS